MQLLHIPLAEVYTVLARASGFEALLAGEVLQLRQFVLDHVDEVERVFLTFLIGYSVRSGGRICLLAPERTGQHEMHTALRIYVDIEM